MDPRLLEYYNRELRFVREMGGEFAREFPKIAGRLGLETFECADPYVERLLEGFAFLAARVQLKIDAEFPAFTQHLLEMVYPHYLAPTPSMAVVELQPDLDEGALADGFDIPRDTVLRGTLGRGEQTACEYRTGHAVRLWPLELTAAEYFSHTGPVARSDLSILKRSKAGIRLRLRTTANLTFAQIAPDRPERFQLVLFLQGADQLPFELYAQILGNTIGVLVQPVARPLPWIEVLPASALSPLGFSEEDALLPFAPSSFQGYRNLHEYFAFPQRFLFVAVDGLGPTLQRLAAPEVDLILLLGQPAPSLEGVLDAGNFRLHCTPAINLFPKRFDRIHLNDVGPDYHVVPDRTRPMDFEVYRVDGVTGYGAGTTDAREFRPFYAPAHLGPARRIPCLLQRPPGPTASLIAPAASGASLQLRGQRGLRESVGRRPGPLVGGSAPACGHRTLHQPGPAAEHAGWGRQDRLHPGVRGAGPGRAGTRRADPAAALASPRGHRLAPDRSSLPELPVHRRHGRRQGRRGPAGAADALRGPGKRQRAQAGRGDPPVSSRPIVRRLPGSSAGDLWTRSGDHGRLR